MNFLKHRLCWSEFRDLRSEIGPDGRVTRLIPGDTHYGLGVVIAGRQFLVPVSGSLYHWVINHVFAAV